MPQESPSHRRLTKKPVRWLLAAVIVMAAGAGAGWYIARPQRVEIPLEGSVARARPASALGAPVRVGIVAVANGDSVANGALTAAAGLLRAQLASERDLVLVPMPDSERCGGAAPVHLCLELAAARAPDATTLTFSLLDQRTHTVLSDFRTTVDASSGTEDLRPLVSRVALWSAPGAFPLVDGAAADLAVYRDAVRAFTSCDPVALNESRRALRALAERPSPVRPADALLVLMDALDMQARNDAEGIATIRAKSQDVSARAPEQVMALAAVAVSQANPSARDAVARIAANNVRAHSPGIADATEAAALCLAAVHQAR
ncbi:MAG TPA: hypothetical protein VGE27_18225 [Gemmatimonas sp.]|uniref:hypothetical protein n=1 Tax=Gemmatimonas sp. TaxID=1962908 RepID=UPI002ED7D6A6